MGMNFSKLWETVEDRGAWCAVVHGAAEFGHDFVTKQGQHTSYPQMLVSVWAAWVGEHEPGGERFHPTSMSWWALQSIGVCWMKSLPSQALNNYQTKHLLWAWHLPWCWGYSSEETDNIPTLMTHMLSWGWGESKLKSGCLFQRSKSECMTMLICTLPDSHKLGMCCRQSPGPPSIF